MKARALTPDDLEPGEIEILRLGEHHGAAADLSLQDFDSIVRDYEPALRHQATAVIDHDLREPTDPARKGINHGLIQSVRRVKDSVVARIDGITAELRELVNSGRLHAVTPELYQQFRTTNRLYLRAVAFVGADTPAQKGLLRPVLLSEGEGPAYGLPLENPVLRFAEDPTEGAPNMPTKNGEPNPNPTPPAGDPPANPKPPVSAEPAAPAPAPAAPTPTPAPVLQLSEVQKVIEDAVKPLRDQVATLNSRLEEVDPEFGDRAILQFAEELVRDGKIEGKDRERTIARAKLLRGQVLQFGETKVPALADFMEQERSRQPMSHFGSLDVPAPKGGAPVVRENVLQFAEGDGPGFPILVPSGASNEDVARLKRLGVWAKGKGYKSFGEAAPAFEREAEGVHV